MFFIIRTLNLILRNNKWLREEKILTELDIIVTQLFKINLRLFTEASHFTPPH